MRRSFFFPSGSNERILQQHWLLITTAKGLAGAIMTHRDAQLRAKKKIIHSSPRYARARASHLYNLESRLIARSDDRVHLVSCSRFFPTLVLHEFPGARVCIFLAPRELPLAARFFVPVREVVQMQVFCMSVT